MLLSSTGQPGETFSGEIMRTLRLGFVLYDSSNKRVYQLDDQKKSKKFVGWKVMVTGTFDDARNTIHVSEIKAARWSGA